MAGRAGMVSGRVIVVDDDPHVLSSTVRILEEFGLTAFPFHNGYQALEKFQSEPVDAVLSDIKMPSITGIELLEKIHGLDRETPVILMTAYADMNVAIAAIQKGAFDFILKPYEPLHLVNALKKALEFKRLVQVEKDYKLELEKTVERRTLELGHALKKVEGMSREIIERLAAAAELRDDDTGRHNQRIGLYAGALARAMGMPGEFAETITLASAMHDVGKIGIPDSILLKPGGLSAGEFEVVKSHPDIGLQLLSGSSHGLLQMAARVAHSHHERWDGGGYPQRLKGEAIPIEGRIVMLADQYDALRSQRVYKPAFDQEKTWRILTEGDGRTLPEHFDPQVLRAFGRVADELDGIFRSQQDVLP